MNAIRAAVSGVGCLSCGWILWKVLPPDVFEGIAVPLGALAGVVWIIVYDCWSRLE